MDVRRLLLSLLQVYSWLLLIRVVLSWVNPAPRNPLLVQIVRITEPVLRPLRAILPVPGIDLSPLLAFVLIQLLARAIA
jgi:YggT family protein